MSEKVVQALSWFKQLLQLPARERSHARADVLSQIEEFSAKGEGSRETSAGRELAKALSKMKLVGFVPSISYAKESGDAEELSAVWVHPFGTETLLYKHPSLPVLLIVNANLRLNETFLSEMKLNSKQRFELMGISG